jgi:hypothetical protein
MDGEAARSDRVEPREQWSKKLRPLPQRAKLRTEQLLAKEPWLITDMACTDPATQCACTLIVEPKRAQVRTLRLLPRFTPPKVDVTLVPGAFLPPTRM